MFELFGDISTKELPNYKLSQKGIIYIDYFVKGIILYACDIEKKTKWFWC
jgi:hypothetical protein